MESHILLDTKTLIERAFNGELKRIFAPKNEVKQFLLKHPRKKICIENLVTEVRKAELSNAIKMDLPKLEFLGKSFAKTFAKLALNLKERELMTNLQKAKEQKMANEAEELKKFFDDNVKQFDITKTLEG